LVGIPPAPRGAPQIEVTFEVDANGILNVSAADKATGREQQLRITPTSGLSADEIDRLIAEAVTAADADRRTKEVVGLRNRLDSLVRNTQRTFKEFSGALSNAERERGQRTLSDGEEAALSDDPEEIRRAMQAVEQLATTLTLAMMSPAAAPSALDPNERL